MSPKLLNIFLAATPIVLYMMLIKPLLTGTGTFWYPEMSIRTLQVVNEEYSAALSNIEQIKTGIDAIYKDYSNIKPEILIKNEQMISDTVDEARIRNEVVAIATKQGLAIDSLTVTKDRRGSKIANFYTVSFSLRSRYPAFKKLLEEYEKSTRFYHIDFLSLSRQKAETIATQSLSDKDMLNIQVRFRVHQVK